jgi:predicted ATPase/DNA-binding SARP family transcriptional activator
MSATRAAAARLSLRLFGPFEAWIDGCPLPRLRSRRGEWLLSLLVLRAHQPVERSWLAGTLWPDSSEQQALTNLRVTLKDLRRALGTEAARLCSPSPHTLLMELDDADVDLLQFDAAIVRGDEQALAEAVSLYRGPLLEGCVEAWALQERQVREQAYLGALEQLAALARERGELGEAERYLRRAVAVDPLRERAQRRLLQVLAAAGSYGAATEQYRELRQRLHREVNAEPAPETRAVYEVIRAEARQRSQASPSDRQDPAAALARSPGSSSLETLAVPPHDLPVPLTPLLGREQEVGAVRALLLQDDARLVTLTGPPGVGKSRLGLQVAADLLQDFPDGVFLVLLAPVTDPRLVLSTIAQALGVRESAGQLLSESLRRHLVDKQALLLLDNFEQVLAAGPELAELLASAPRLKILVTSRAALRVRGEREFPVPPLAVPDLRRLPPLPALTRYPAVALFIQRAVSVRPEFALMPENAAAVAEICCRLDGLPLAIELAAARVKLLPPQALLARLVGAGLVPAPGGRPQRSPLQLLTGGARDLPARQQTLRDTIGWSYDLLNPEEQKLLRRLGVFGGGCTIAAAEAVCGVEGGAEVLEGIASLLDKSLLRQVEEADGEPRFLMLETIREYAAEQLAASGERETLRQRHAQYCLQRTDEPGEFYIRDIDNCRAALVWALESEDAETGLRLGAGLHWFWWNNGLWAEGQEVLEKLLSLPGAAGRTAVRARALNAAGWMAKNRRGQTATARAFMEECRSIWQELGNRAGVASCHIVLGQIADTPAVSQARFEEGVAICREINDLGGAAGLVQNLGHLAEGLGDWSKAEACYAEALELYRAANRHVNNISEMQSCLADAAWHREQYARAAHLYQESLAGHRRSELPNQIPVARTLIGLGRVLAREREVQSAVRIWAAASRILEEFGWNWSELREMAERAQTDPQAMETAWQEGCSMTLQQALTYALNEAGSL